MSLDDKMYLFVCPRDDQLLTHIPQVAFRLGALLLGDGSLALLDGELLVGDVALEARVVHAVLQLPQSGADPLLGGFGPLRRSGQHLETTQVVEGDLLGSEDGVQHRREVLPKNRRDRWGKRCRLGFDEPRWDDLGLGDLSRALGLVEDVWRSGYGRWFRPNGGSGLARGGCQLVQQLGVDLLAQDAVQVAQYVGQSRGDHLLASPLTEEPPQRPARLSFQAAPGQIAVPLCVEGVADVDAGQERPHEALGDLVRRLDEVVEPVRGRRRQDPGVRQALGVVEHALDRVAPRGDPRRVGGSGDEGAAGAAFIAGTAYAARVAPWRDTVESMLDDTEGLANAWVLSPSATDRFNYLVQPAHQVSEGFVRTFLPGVDIGNALDAERHRYLTRRSLEREPSRALRRLFGQRAREQMIAARLPDVLRDLDRILRQEIDSELLDELTVAPRGPLPPFAPNRCPYPGRRRSSTSPSARLRSPSPRSSHVLVEPEPAPLAEPVAAALGQHLASMLHAVLGTEEITLKNLGRLEVLARTAQRAEATKQRISARLRELQDSVDNAGLERDIAYEELAVEQRERAVAEEERAEAERRLRYVRKQLIVAGRADVVHVAGRQSGMRDAQCDDAVMSCAAAYRQSIRLLANQPLLSRSFQRMDVQLLHSTVTGSRYARRSLAPRAWPALERATARCRDSPPN